MYYNFEKLNIWQESRLLIKEVYRITKNFPKDETFILESQLKRAVISIALNIAEGSDKRSRKDFVRYLRTSLGSINEVITSLYIAKDLGYLNDNSFQKIYQHCHKLSAMINALIKKLNETEN